MSAEPATSFRTCRISPTLDRTHTAGTAQGFMTVSSPTAVTQSSGGTHAENPCLGRCQQIGEKRPASSVHREPHQSDRRVFGPSGSLRNPHPQPVHEPNSGSERSPHPIGGCCDNLLGNDQHPMHQSGALFHEHKTLLDLRLRHQAGPGGAKRAGLPRLRPRPERTERRAPGQAARSRCSCSRMPRTAPTRSPRAARTRTCWRCP